MSTWESVKKFVKDSWQYFKKLYRGLRSEWKTYKTWQKLVWILFFILLPFLVIGLVGLVLGILVLALVIVIIGGIVNHIISEPTTEFGYRGGMVRQAPQPPRQAPSGEPPVPPPPIPDVPRDDRDNNR